jgi:hypothetical protein
MTHRGRIIVVGNVDGTLLAVDTLNPHRMHVLLASVARGLFFA